MTPSSLQVDTLASAVEAGLSKCTTLQDLIVKGSPPSVTAGVLKGMAVNRSLEEVTLIVCDFGMCSVCMHACVRASLCVREHGYSLQCVCFSNPPVSLSKITCLLLSLAGGIDEEVVGFCSHLKEVKQLRKVEMTVCKNLSPSLIATICRGLCSSNSMEEVVVTSEVSVLSVRLTTPYKLLSSVSKLTLKTVNTCSVDPFPSLGGAPMMLYNCLVHTVLVCSLQFSPLQFCILCSLLRN